MDTPRGRSQNTRDGPCLRDHRPHRLDHINNGDTPGALQHALITCGAAI